MDTKIALATNDQLATLLERLPHLPKPGDCARLQNWLRPEVQADLTECYAACLRDPYPEFDLYLATRMQDLITDVCRLPIVKTGENTCLWIANLQWLGLNLEVIRIMNFMQELPDVRRILDSSNLQNRFARAVFLTRVLHRLQLDAANGVPAEPSVEVQAMIDSIVQHLDHVMARAREPWAETINEVALADHIIL